MIIICKKLIDLTPFFQIESDVTLNLNPEPDEIALFRILVENTMMSEQTCFSRKYTRAHGFDVSPVVFRFSKFQAHRSASATKLLETRWFK